MHGVNSLATSAVRSAAAPAAFVDADTKYVMHLYVTRRARRPVIRRALHCMILHPPFQMENYQIQYCLYDLFTINKIIIEHENESQ